MKRTELSLLRLAAQRIVGGEGESVHDIVRWLGAIQAQDLPGAMTSVALRAKVGFDEVRESFDRDQVVRSWPMRGTLHLVAGEP